MTTVTIEFYNGAQWLRLHECFFTVLPDGKRAIRALAEPLELPGKGYSAVILELDEDGQWVNMAPVRANGEEYWYPVDHFIEFHACYPSEDGQRWIVGNRSFTVWEAEAGFKMLEDEHCPNLGSLRVREVRKGPRGTVGLGPVHPYDEQTMDWAGRQGLMLTMEIQF